MKMNCRFGLNVHLVQFLDEKNCSSDSVGIVVKFLLYFHAASPKHCCDFDKEPLPSFELWLSSRACIRRLMYWFHYFSMGCMKVLEECSKVFRDCGQLEVKSQNTTSWMRNIYIFLNALMPDKFFSVFFFCYSVMLHELIWLWNLMGQIQPQSKQSSDWWHYVLQLQLIYGIQTRFWC